MDRLDMFAGSMLIVLIVVLLVVIAVYCIYLYNLQKTLEQVSPENRDIAPTNAWLLLIPLFNYIYRFMFYPKLSSSVEKEYGSRGLPADGDFAKNLGTALAAAGAAGFVVGRVPALAAISSIIGLGVLVLWIVYWVKTAKFKQTLATSPKGNDGTMNMNSDDLLDS